MVVTILTCALTISIVPGAAAGTQPADRERDINRRG
jgi:hypothetical protein